MSKRAVSMCNTKDILTADFIENLSKNFKFRDVQPDMKYPLYDKLREAILNIQLDIHEYKNFPKLADSKKRLKEICASARKLRENLEDLCLDTKANQAFGVSSIIDGNSSLQEDAIKICEHLISIAIKSELKISLNTDTGGHNPYPWRDNFISSLCRIFQDGTGKEVYIKQDRISQEDFGEFFIFVKKCMDFVVNSEIFAQIKFSEQSDSALETAIRRNKVFQIFSGTAVDVK